MLSPDGLAGSAAYVVGDGFVKASLFVAVGIAQYRLAGVEEAQLSGHGQRLWFPASIFALGGLAIAGLPPFGPFLGHALVEDAAASQAGYGWLPAAMLVISALTGAAVLRTGARVFLELGPRPDEDQPGSKADEESEIETDEPHTTTPALLALPAAALLAAGLAWGVVPGLTHSLIAAAAHFTDHSGYARAVLAGVPATPVMPATRGPSGVSYVYGVGATLTAVALAAFALFFERLPRPAAQTLAGLRALHSGRIGDYVAWLSVGVATIGGALALTLR
jgi:multicomponent Na+:H+ antiporter subunit D